MIVLSAPIIPVYHDGERRIPILLDKVLLFIHKFNLKHFVFLRFLTITDIVYLHIIMCDNR